MARIRKKDNSQFPISHSANWLVGKYIRLSREDGNDVSESVVNQNKILDEELPGYFPDGNYTVVDVYIDDGRTGTSDDTRPEFQRLIRDIKCGRINCVVVKNLSRAFRNSANQGKFLEEIIPLYNSRFISLYEPHIDTFLNPEITHSLEVSITGFMNEQYAYKTSCDIRRTFDTKRRKGEFIGAFAPYGYQKDPQDKNKLVIDEEAAKVVQDIFAWFLAGMSKCGIAKRLNELGIPNPTKYKALKGLKYESPHSKENDGFWNPTTVYRLLQNPVYLGTMVQGRSKVISYKVHKQVAVEKKDWYVVENTHPAIIDKETFEQAQNLHLRDTRTAPGESKVNLFSGFCRCADCKKAMHRNHSRGKYYYVCRTNKDKSKDACTTHSIREDKLENVVLTAIQVQIKLVASLEETIKQINDSPTVRTESSWLNAMLAQRKKELQKVTNLVDGLYADWKGGFINQNDYRRLKAKYNEQVSQLQETIQNLENEKELMEKGVNKENPYLTTFLKYKNIRSLDRGLLVALVKHIFIHESGEVEIEFNFADEHRRILEFIWKNQDNPSQAAV